MSNPDRDRQLEFLGGYCAAHMDEDGLDELVHDLKSKEASALNNEGVAVQLEYILDCLGAVEAARAVIDAAGREQSADEQTLPECFRTVATIGPDRPWQAVYRVCHVVGGDPIHVGRVTVAAPDEAEAIKKAIAWAHDNDPRCDERVDYYVEAEIERDASDEDNGDEQDNSAG